MPRSSLFSLLHGATGVVVDTSQAVSFALDVARANSQLNKGADENLLL